MWSIHGVTFISAPMHWPPTCWLPAWEPKQKLLTISTTVLNILRQALRHIWPALFRLTRTIATALKRSHICLITLMQKPLSFMQCLQTCAHKSDPHCRRSSVGTWFQTNREQHCHRGRSITTQWLQRPLQTSFRQLHCQMTTCSFFIRAAQPACQRASCGVKKIYCKFWVVVAMPLQASRLLKPWKKS